MKHLANPLTRLRRRHGNDTERSRRHGLTWLGLGRPRSATRPGPRGPRATPRPDAFGRLVALYTAASTLRDCALVEVRVGEDALSDGDEARANQHFAYSRHYHRRADEAEATIHRELDRLRRDRLDWEGMSASALSRARQRLYGAAELTGRPRFE